MNLDFFKDIKDLIKIFFFSRDLQFVTDVNFNFLIFVWMLFHVFLSKRNVQGLQICLIFVVIKFDIKMTIIDLNSI
jgi:hypothetical protein